MSDFNALRRIALTLPDAVEVAHFKSPSFRVAGKIFATASPEKNRATLKLDRDMQTMLFDLRPEVFTPAVWGRLIWTYVELDRIEDGELEALVTRSWRLVAPKQLAKAYAAV